MEDLVKKYEEAIGEIICYAESPTVESVQEIENTLKIKLPMTLIKFAELSKSYGNWLASIGPDYTSNTHIIRINEELRKSPKFPQNFVAINVGYDEAWDCIDLDTFEPARGEYLITYWAEDVSPREADLYGSFHEYISGCIKNWSSQSQ